MKPPSILICFLSTLLISSGEEQPVVPRIESVGLFKNGLAVVRATFPVTAAGLYRWDQVPRAVHGSFWMESDGVVSVRATTRVLETPDEKETLTGNLQADLAGKPVTITTKARDGAAAATLKGVVLSLPPTAPAKSWDADYSSLTGNSYSPWYGYRSFLPQATALPAPSSGSFLVLTDESGGRRYVDSTMIADLAVAGPFGPVSHPVEKPVLVFDVRQVPSDGGLVRVTWLAKGLAWLPAYQVDLGDPASLKIRQSAVIRNEMTDLSGTEVRLISGFPNVRFGAVDSPLWQGTGLAAFFQQLGQSTASAGGPLDNVLSQQMISSNSGSSMPQARQLPENGEQGNPGDDIHYESIGNRDLKAGDSLSLDIAAASARCERVVEWTIPDPRDTRGRYRQNNGSGSGREETREDVPWDAVRFSNPFKFPMTTAPAVIMEGGKFRGQSISGWVNPGQTTCLKITRALAIHTESSEMEEEGKREVVWIAGNDYQRTEVTGRLLVKNHRSAEVSLSIRGEFSGELLEADENPEKSLRAEGVFSVNPLRELGWNFKLGAGQEKTLTYRYRVLVDR